jgi:coatomer protein complex subunit gamma
MYLRRLTYLVIKELASVSRDIIIVTSSLTQDMNNSKLDSVYKASAIRSLGSIVDGSMVQSVERFVKTAMADRNGLMASAALVTGAYMFDVNKEVVKRWQPEVQQALTLAPSKGISQFHALGLAYLIKQTDRNAVMKLIQQMQQSAGNPLSTCFFLRIYGSVLAKDPLTYGLIQQSVTHN